MLSVEVLVKKKKMKEYKKKRRRIKIIQRHYFLNTTPLPVRSYFCDYYFIYFMIYYPI